MGLHFRLISLLQPDSVIDSRGRENVCTGVELDLYGQPCSMGMLSVMVLVNTWIEQNDVTIMFNTHALQIKDIWNARVISGGDGKSASATFRLQQQDGSWFGERKSAFGFAADGIISQLPTMSCTLNKPFPRPPPPALPALPPSGPLSFRGDRAGCFLGGSAVFTHEPDIEPVLGWMHSFEVIVSLDRWQEGVMVILDFFGARLHQHPLKVLSTDPAEAVRQEDLTGHSVVMKLLPSPVRQFKIVASGGVEGMRALRCNVLRASPPLPMPSPPRRTVALSPPLRPPSAPGPPPPPEQETRAIVGRERTFLPPPWPSASEALSEKKTEVYLSIYVSASALAMIIYASSKLCELRRRGKLSVAALLVALSRRKMPVRGLLRRWSTGAPVSHFKGSAAEEREAWSLDDELRASQPRVVLHMDGELHVLEVNMRSVTCIRDLQEAVADACADLNVEGAELGELVMYLEGEEGQFETVTNSLPFERVQCARQLQLVSQEGGAQLISIGEAPESTRCKQLDDEGAQPGSAARCLGLPGIEMWPPLPGKKACADAMSRANYQQLEYSNLD